MTAKEMRELLENIPDDETIQFRILVGCCGDTEQLSINDAESYIFPDGTYSLYVDFDKLPGYHTCKQEARTRRQHDAYKATATKCHSRNLS